MVSMKESAALEDALHISASVSEGGNGLDVRSSADKTKTFAQPTAEYYMFTQVKFPLQLKIGKRYVGLYNNYDSVSETSTSMGCDIIE